jgi:hypothetical protein
MKHRGPGTLGREAFKLHFVMPGLVPGIHVLATHYCDEDVGGFLLVARKLPVCDPVPASAVLLVPGDQLNLEVLLFVGQRDAAILLVQGNQLSATLVSRKPGR